LFIVAHNGAPIWGGAERATALLLAGLRERGHRVLLLCNEAEVARRAEDLGVPTEIARLGGDAALHHAAAMGRRLRALKPDAFIVGTFRKLFLASLAARIGGVRRVVARVGLESDTPRSAKYRFVLARWVDAVVVNASRMRPAFAALPGWSDARVPVIHNGVTVPAADGSMRAELGIPADAPVVGTVARLARQKRIDRLLHSLALLPPETHCVVAGGGGRLERLRTLADELGIGARVHFVGHRDDTGTVLATLDLFVTASDSEGLSNAMLEALACGVPVVSTPVSGAEDALEPLPDGRGPGVVAGWEPEELAAAIRFILNDPELRARMSEAARERAEERFGVAGMLDRWERVLRGDAA
jgi:glycosyltransferase involved in cell wall biosynthesis